jgi:hypothetical protein
MLTLKIQFSGSVANPSLRRPEKIGFADNAPAGLECWNTAMFGYRVWRNKIYLKAAAMDRSEQPLPKGAVYCC